MFDEAHNIEGIARDSARCGAGLVPVLPLLLVLTSPHLTSLCLPGAQCNATSCDLTEGELSDTENSLRKMVDIGPVMQRAQHRALAGFVSRLLQFLAFARDKLRPEDYTSGHNVWSGEEMKALLLQRVQVDAASFEVLKNYLGQVPTRGWRCQRCTRSHGLLALSFSARLPLMSAKMWCPQRASAMTPRCCHQAP